jgi:aspartate 1-decarboxylase
MKLRSICKSKIHHAIVTDSCLDYIGSIAIDKALLNMVDIIPGEEVSVWNITNGERFQTYALPAPEGSGSIIVNGAGARKCSVGDKIIIAAFFLADESVCAKMVRVDGQNRFLEWLTDNTRA